MRGPRAVRRGAAPAVLVDSLVERLVRRGEAQRDVVVGVAPRTGWIEAGWAAVCRAGFVADVFVASFGEKVVRVAEGRASAALACVPVLVWGMDQDRDALLRSE